MTTSQHRELLARHKKVLPNWISLYYEEPIALVSGEGRCVTDAEGNRYLDFFGGILTTSIGHNIPEIREPIERQLARIAHTSTLYLIEQQIEVAERLAGLSGIPDAKVFFVNSGSEANDAALLLSTLSRGSDQILALEHSYHGRTFGAGAITDIPIWSATTLSPVKVHTVKGGYKFHSPLHAASDEEYIRDCLDAFCRVVDNPTLGNIASFFVEPIQGLGGFIVPPNGLIASLANAAKERGILFVSDEVQTALGRTGDHFFGIAHDGVVPDLITFAKGMANGLPIGGVIAHADVMDAIQVNSISTFGGNPLVMAAALATLEYIERHDLVRHVAEQGRAMLDGLEKMKVSHPEIGDARGKGLMGAIEFVHPGTSEPDADRAIHFLERARENGILVGRGGIFGNCIRMAPPMTITASEMDEGLGRLEDAFDR